MNQDLNLNVGQSLLLTPMMLQSLNILHADILELKSLLEKEYSNNPLIEFVETGSDVFSDAQFSIEWVGAQTNTLKEDLLFQLNTLRVSRRLIGIGRFIIECIDEKGYLRERISDIANYLGVSEKEVKRTTKMIQGLEPAGVCARTLRERIYLILIRQDVRNEIAETIVRKYFDLLVHNNVADIVRRIGSTRDEIKKAIHFIRRLNVDIVSGYDAKLEAQVIPEVLVSCRDGEITIELINKLPKIKLVDGYDICKKVANEAIEDNFKVAYYNAYGLIKGIEKRYETLIKVVNAIVNKQRAFFLHDEAMAPLNYSDIAQQTGLSTSTVCRTVTSKYMLYNNSVYELRQFFPSALQSGKSSVEVKHKILELLKHEDMHDTLSDEQIRRLLEKKV